MQDWQRGLGLLPASKRHSSSSSNAIARRIIAASMAGASSHRRSKPHHTPHTGAQSDVAARSLEAERQKPAEAAVGSAMPDTHALPAAAQVQAGNEPAASCPAAADADKHNAGAYLAAAAAHNADTAGTGAALSEPPQAAPMAPVQQPDAHAPPNGDAAGAAARALEAVSTGAHHADAARKAGMTTVKETRRFAGQDVQIEREMKAGSKAAAAAAERAAAAAGGGGLDSVLHGIQGARAFSVAPYACDAVARRSAAIACLGARGRCTEPAVAYRCVALVCKQLKVKAGG